MKLAGGISVLIPTQIVMVREGVYAVIVCCNLVPGASWKRWRLNDIYAPKAEQHLFGDILNFNLMSSRNDLGVHR